ncbi:MAG: sensor domain-containing diguanylate cyclase [Candidatus Omnitrophica bacterium]|nr:sensor domain-containing diguanylate cyclase [Candidatus Omnitrophota bacterium]
MGHTKIKNLIGIISLLAWIASIIFAKPLKDAFLLSADNFTLASKIFLLFLSIPIFFINLALGISFGLPIFFITALLLVRLPGPGICGVPLAAFALTSFAGYRLNRVFLNETKVMEVRKEKEDEEINLLKDDIRSHENQSERMRSSLEKVTNLKNVIEKYSYTLSEDEILDLIIENSFGLFQSADRVLLYLVDTQKRELKLARAKKRDSKLSAKSKKGDIFDRWVLKHRLSLIVEDIHKDFRFSLDKEELEDGFTSLISTPLTSENKILGILRIDSLNPDRFSQSDIRFLDIMADLSAVSLQNASLYKKVEDLAIHDSLTGLYVHKYFTERLNDEIKRSLRNNRDFSLIMCDLDNFKDYNDKYGHNAGDLVLKHVSSILKSLTRPGDVASRYGGEEFMLLILNKNKEEALEIAEELRQKIKDTPLILRREETHITVSIGVASCPKETRFADELLKLVDARLYNAKKTGKNKVCA